MKEKFCLQSLWLLCAAGTQYHSSIVRLYACRLFLNIRREQSDKAAKGEDLLKRLKKKNCGKIPSMSDMKSTFFSFVCFLFP